MNQSADMLKSTVGAPHHHHPGLQGLLPSDAHVIATKNDIS